MTKTRLTTIVAAVVTILSLVFVNPTASSARTYTSTHDGIAVAMPASALAPPGGAVQIVSHVWPVRHRQIKSHMTRIYQSGRLIARATSPSLRPGTYRISVRVLYRRWSWVTKSGQRVKSYGRVRAVATGQKYLVVKARHARHACTRTSSGSCIQGGEFCPQTDYGMTGWDAQGVAWVCSGDRTHPHWE